MRRQINTLFVTQLTMKEAISQFTAWRKFKVKRGTWKGYDSDLRFFCLYLGRPNLSDLKLEQVIGYLNGLHELGWEMNGIIRKTVAIRKFLEWCRRAGYAALDEEMVPLPAKEYKMPRIADDGDVRKLLDSIPGESKDPRHARNAALIRLYIDTGARNEEILRLDVGMVDFKARRAVIKTEKSRGRRPFREIYWNADTAAFLDKWMARRKRLFRLDDEALFISISSAAAGRRLTNKGVGEMLRRQCLRAGVPMLNAHSFRHRRARKIVEAGGSNADVMNVLGHATIASTTIYTVLQGPALEARARKFLDHDSQNGPRGAYSLGYGTTVP